MDVRTQSLDFLGSLYAVVKKRCAVRWPMPVAMDVGSWVKEPKARRLMWKCKSVDGEYCKKRLSGLMANENEAVKDPDVV